MTPESPRGSGPHPQPRFATIASFDEEHRSGTALTDSGELFTFEGAAFDAGPLLHVRVGQRVRCEMTGDDVTYVTLSTFAGSSPDKSSPDNQ